MIPRTFTAGMLALLALISLLGASSAGAQTYTVTDLGSLGTYETFAFAVNDSSRVAGYSYVPLVPGPGFTRHAFLWQKGQMQDLGLLPGGTYSWGTDINEVGQVSGFADDVNIYGRPTVYRNGAMEDLGLTTTLGGESRGINNLTEIAGYFVTNTYGTHATYWSDATSFVDLTTATAGTAGVAEDLNDHTQLVGWSHGAPCGAFIYPRGALWEDPGTGWTVTDLAPVSGHCMSHAWDINDAGLVVGESGAFSGVAVKWQKSALGVWQVATLGSLGGTASLADAVNNRSQIVGQAQIAGGANHAFLWQCGSMIDLNSRIPASSGWVLTAATGINDLGQIVGYGKLNGGNYRGFLLKPGAEICCKAAAVPVDDQP
ncbi:MAG: hypothetical protein QOH06_4442 [Acidobacteriota bacterium]|jgi:probable HAF family extracellular repeat protein|nr:hypothetical protein [Acidobacteriota bacterium]